jgi:hypothetical protein
MASPTTGPTPVTRLKLEHHGAAGSQGRSHLQDDLVERVVPWRDGADHADRLAHDQRVADLLFPLEGLGRLGGVGEGTGGQPHLDPTGQRHRHADFLGDDLGDLVGAGGQRLADAGQQLGPLFTRGL